MSEKFIVLKDVGFSYKSRTGLFRHESYEALSGVSFNLRKGETLGIVGRNGCGKSTLLRILSGIFQPDSGTIEIYCEKISLLSLAIGFDYELSGSQNAILSSMLLGSSRLEAAEMLDEIIGFAELEEFVDRPLKTYSSGMRARLGFSVGVKMNADVLLIDEVLGVGDASFREKAEDALINRIYSNQSVVFVSHSAPMIRKLCDRVVWLEGGVVKAIGAPDPVLEAYWSELKQVKGVGNTQYHGGIRTLEA